MTVAILGAGVMGETVLSGLVKRTVKGVRLLPAGDAAEVAAVADSLRQESEARRVQPCQRKPNAFVI